MVLCGIFAFALVLAGPPPGEAQYQAGIAALKGESIALSKAAKSFEEACTAGHLHACVRLGLQVQDGRGVAYDPKRAAELYTKVCEGGYGIGCFNLAGLHMTGNGVVEDPAKAAELAKRSEALYAKQCDAGDLQWCTNLGVLYEGPFLGQPDFAKAAAVYKKACDKNAGDWCVNLALMQAYGDGMPKDVKKASALMQKACNANVMLACGTLGQMHMKTELGLSGKPAKGVPLLEKACAGGEVQACAVLSAENGLGERIPRNDVLAKKYGERACALGSSSACFIQGMALGDAGDFAGALTWLERSCHIGEGRACSAASALAGSGRVPSTPAKVAALRSDACRLGDGEACLAILKDREPLPLGEARKKAFLEEACRKNIPGSCL